MSVAPNSTTNTPPLSDTDKAAKKAAKKERKLAKKALKESTIAEDEPAAASPSTEANEAVVDNSSSSKKRKADETDDERKARKAAKKAKKEARKAATVNESETDPTPKVKAAAAPVTPIPTASSTEAQAFIKENNISYEPENAATQFAPVLSFANLPLEAGLKKGLASYTKPTPIQSASFPITMAGRDVIGIAETGSGKTVAFGVPAISHILSLPSSSKPNKNPIACLVVAPTRELAMQTHNNLAAVASSIPTVSSICIYGGVSKDDQKRQLRKEGPRIVVGTPGRILDLAGEGALDLSHVSWLVLDEADRMLDKGFENDIREIIKKCMPSPEQPIGITSGDKPQARITCMFSATWPQSVRRLAADFMCSPIRITVGADELTANSRVEQVVHVLQDGREKERRLLGVLNEHGFTRSGKGRQGGGGEGKDRDKALVFALYKKEATRVTEFLQRNGYQAGCIQGDMSQEKRSKSLQDFKDGKVQLLVATDVAARGLDIPKVELVVNQTFPLTIEDYIHRIGRTGRAGRTGKSVTFFTEADKAHAGELIRVLKDGGHAVPEGLDQWGTTIKKATHSSYGSHFRDDIKGTATKIKFD
ncbi:RNA-dependent ATPase [Microbotryomycetes sp. JL221]|nr:RNA-dependent ATPase [Microbotryomycetes sp. JL221]